MAVMYDVKARVIKQEQGGPGLYYLVLEAPPVAREGRPGQFVHLRVRDQGYDPLLRRPFSLFDRDRDRGTITLVYRVVGRGTAILARRVPGQQLDVMGPLGRPFTRGENCREVVLVGGGVGAAPLHFLARSLGEGGTRVEVLLGARRAGGLVGREDFRALGLEPRVAVEEGDGGTRGQVTGLLAGVLEEKGYDFLYACGPRPMLEKVAALARGKSLGGELSLEEHMACGTGACLGCAFPVKGEGPGGGIIYKRVCQDGPVFPVEVL